MRGPSSSSRHAFLVLRDQSAITQTLGGRGFLSAGDGSGAGGSVIAAELAARRTELPILTAWAHRVDPPDQYRSTLLPEMDRLDGESPG